jgi:two-component system, OmpR family, response regulator QseB
MTQLLLIEDDHVLGDALTAAFTEEGYKVVWYQDASRALDALAENLFAAVILDVNLPGDVSGLELLSQVRESGNETPVMILSARDRTRDRVTGLDLGGDDYVTKPFELDELMARVRALVRRGQGAVGTQLCYADLNIDQEARSVRWKDQPVTLSRREYAMLQLLLRNVGRVISRAQMEGSIYPSSRQIESNAVEVHIHSIRRKIPGLPIRTVRGVGYIIDREAS